MQGVLPFTPTPAHFVSVLVVLTLLVIATLAIMSNWHLRLQPMFQDFFRATTDIIFDGLRQGRGIAHDVNCRGRAMKQAIFSRQRRRNGDIENGPVMELDDLGRI